MPQATTPLHDDTPRLAVKSDVLYEVVDGHILEKASIGAYEILIGSFLNTRLDGFARESNCGRAVSEMLFDFGAGLSQRRPDVAYVSYDRWPRQRRVPWTQAWAVIPELTVEVISPSNTFEEILGKVHEYFQAGVQRVWVVAPPHQQVYVYQSPSHICVLNVQDELTGDPFLDVKMCYSSEACAVSQDLKLSTAVVIRNTKAGTREASTCTRSASSS